MKQTTKRRLFNVFHLAVAMYAAILLTGSIVNIAYAQEIRDYRVENLESRMAALDALKLDARLTRIETILMSLQDESHGGWTAEAANGGVALLLARAVFLAIKNRNTRGVE
jgi:hypothetical protein